MLLRRTVSCLLALVMAAAVVSASVDKCEGDETTEQCLRDVWLLAAGPGHGNAAGFIPAVPRCGGLWTGNLDARGRCWVAEVFRPPA
jgi:hypothetical protein